jgi:hypothetical protein
MSLVVVWEGGGRPAMKLPARHSSFTPCAPPGGLENDIIDRLCRRPGIGL